MKYDTPVRSTGVFTVLMSLPLHILIFSAETSGLSVGAYPLDRVLRCLAVGHGIEHQGHEQRGHHVKDGVLLNEYGSENDTAHQLPALFVPEVFAAGEGDVCADGVEYVDAGEQVCGSVRLPEPAHELVTDTVAQHYILAHVMTVRING